MKNNPNTNLIWGLICLVLLIVGFSFLPKQKMPIGQACTLEAMICPDGSAVGRTGPNCEFAACPESSPVDTSSWETFSDEMVGVSFLYPETLQTTYISTVDWPPQVLTNEESFTCTEAGSTAERAGGTMRTVIDDNEYCVTKVSEGAAGSTYTSYAYARSMTSGGTTIMTFSLRMPQCGNYDDPEQSVCMSEQATFSIDPIVGAMFATLSI